MGINYFRFFLGRVVRFSLVSAASSLPINWRQIKTNFDWKQHSRVSWGANDSLFCHSSINRSCFSVVYDTSTSVHTWQVASVKGMKGAHAAETCMCTMNALNTMTDLSKVSNGPTNSEYYLVICVGDFRTIHRFTSVGVSAGRFSVSIRKRDIFVVFEFERKKSFLFFIFIFHFSLPSFVISVLYSLQLLKIIVIIVIGF